MNLDILVYYPIMQLPVFGDGAKETMTFLVQR